MPMDGFTLSFMEKELAAALVGGRVDKMNQPEKDTLVILIRSAGMNHRLLLSANASQARAQLTKHTYENPKEPPMFCMLMRKHLGGARVAAIEQVEGDRILKITFDCLDELSVPVQKILYLEIMNRHSNLTLVSQDGTIVDSVKHVNSEMSRVRTLLPGGKYQLPPRQDKWIPSSLSLSELQARMQTPEMSVQKMLMENIAGMAGVCSKEVCAQVNVHPKSQVQDYHADALAKQVVDFFSSLDERFAPVALYDDAGLVIDYFPFAYRSFCEENQKAMPSLSEAMDTFYLGRDLRQRMQQRSAGLQKHIKTALERCKKKQAIMFDALKQGDTIEQYRIYGELITANLHQIKRGDADITVLNYYDPECQELTIPLTNTLTPAQNAQSYYKRYRKAKLAKQYAKEQMSVLENDLLVLENALDDLDKCATTTDLAEIRMALTQSGFVRPDATMRKQKKVQEGKPYRFVAEDGTEIFVGKNSIQNDRLTLHARGNETWLHAQNIPGSHVIIRTEDEPSDEALLWAAKLATYFSKGRNHPQMAIDYTKRKYVKKAAGSPAGFVTYTRFQTLIIGLTPSDFATIMKQSNA